MTQSAGFEREVHSYMHEIGERARRVSRQLAIVKSELKNDALLRSADLVSDRVAKLLSANLKDVTAGEQNGLSTAMLDRLRLDEQRVHSIADALREIAALEDPVGEVIAGFERPNGLSIERVRTPLGVVGVIFESRPNVTADAGALCLKAGNATILRGGSDSMESAKAIHDCLVGGLTAAGLSPDSIQLVTTTDRRAVGELLAGLNGNLDVLVPRGGKGLVSRVQTESRVPVFAHLEGICHTYVEASSDLEMAKSIVVNAKMRRSGICGATETLLIDRGCLDSHLDTIVSALQTAGCEVRGDQEIANRIDSVTLATDEDWSKEYLDAIISVKAVSDFEEALNHIARYSSKHTEAIITERADLALRFLNEVDSAIVMHNASTQFADGGEFGMGAEIGIATGKMHARGPVGVEQLTSFKYQVRGTGQVRPSS